MVLVAFRLPRGELLLQPLVVYRLVMERVRRCRPCSDTFCRICLHRRASKISDFLHLSELLGHVFVPERDLFSSREDLTSDSKYSAHTRRIRPGNCRDYHRLLLPLLKRQLIRRRERRRRETCNRQFIEREKEPH